MYVYLENVLQFVSFPVCVSSKDVILSNTSAEICKFKNYIINPTSPDRHSTRASLTYPAGS